LTDIDLCFDCFGEAGNRRGPLDPPSQKKGLMAWIGRQSAFLSSVYYAIGIVGWGFVAVAFIVTAIVNYANRADKSSISTPVEPFGPLLPTWVYSDLLEYRWLIAAAFVAVLAIGTGLQRRRLGRRLSSIGVIDEIFLQYANILTEIRTFPPNGDIRALGGEVDRFLVHTLNRVSVLFSQYTGHRAHVSIKLLDGPNKRLRTVARDQTSIDNRGAIDESLGWYSYEDNTAFNHILTDGAATHFLCNHLKLMAALGRYRNIRPDWKRYYAACLVVPITLLSHGSAIDERSVWGFLTVDNRRGGFDATCSCALLQSFARMYYSVLEELSIVPDADFLSARRNPAGPGGLPP
ncbi:MAG: hypothetical protein ABSA58_22920, partial [Acetobacteraceae bacterium]